MVDWTRPLTRVLVLKTGERLCTLHDATELITRRFGSVTKSAPLEHAIGLLLRAAQTEAPAAVLLTRLEPDRAALRQAEGAPPKSRRSHQGSPVVRHR